MDDDCWTEKKETHQNLVSNNQHNHLFFLSICFPFPRWNCSANNVTRMRLITRAIISCILFIFIFIFFSRGGDYNNRCCKEMKDATKLVMKKTLQQSARGNERNPDCIRGLPVRFNSSLSLRGHRSYLIIKPSNFSFCLLMRREKERDEIRERMYALYLTSKGSPANNELYYIYIFFFCC